MSDKSSKSLGHDAVFERVVEYHRERGDDYSSPMTREAKYRVMLEACDFVERSILDVGCGSGQFEKLLPHSSYTGIDLLFGQNVLEEDRRFDIVVAGGIFYLLTWEWMKILIEHMWGLARESLVFNTVSALAPTKSHRGFYADPSKTLAFCQALTPWVVLRHDYLPHDFTVAMHRR